MNQQQLAAIRQRAAEATTGPWRVGDGYGWWGQNCCIESAEPETGGVICDTVHSSAIEEAANLTFIANARTDIPDLLAEIDRLQNRTEVSAQKIMIDLSANEIDNLKDEIDRLQAVNADLQAACLEAEALLDAIIADYVERSAIVTLVNKLSEVTEKAMEATGNVSNL